MSVLPAGIRRSGLERFRSTLPGLRSLGLLDRFFIAVALAGSAALLLAPVLLSHGPNEIVGNRLEGLSGGAWFGTDDLGRDLWTRTIYGMRSTWFATFPVIASGVVIGGGIGVLAGYSPGLLDSVLMRFTDVTLALPGVLVTIAVAAALGPGLTNTLIAISVTFWTPYARIVRGEVRRLSASTHVEAARTSGIGAFTLARRHILPGLVGPVAVQMSLDVSTVIVTLASLSFLGLGTPPPAPELGAMTAKGVEFLFTAWWVPVVPAVAVALLSVVGNYLGDTVADIATRKSGRS